MRVSQYSRVTHIAKNGILVGGRNNLVSEIHSNKKEKQIGKGNSSCSAAAQSGNRNVVVKTVLTLCKFSYWAG